MISNARDLVESWKGLSRGDRDLALLDAQKLGFLVDWDWHPVVIEKNGHQLELLVAADVVSVGTPEDFVRVPCGAIAAQKLADAAHAVLPTPSLVDAIWRAADVKLEPLPLVPPDGVYGGAWGKYMQSVDALLEHHGLVEAGGERNGHHVAGRGGRAGLVAGHKKDVVNTVRLAAHPTRVAIYGWPELNGKSIQSLSLLHESAYSDYSHGIRLVRDDCELDGDAAWLSELALDKKLCSLVSHEGPVTMRHPDVPKGATA